MRWSLVWGLVTNWSFIVEVALSKTTLQNDKMSLLHYMILLAVSAFYQAYDTNSEIVTIFLSIYGLVFVLRNIILPWICILLYGLTLVTVLALYVIIRTGISLTIKWIRFLLRLLWSRKFHTIVKWAFYSCILNDFFCKRKLWSIMLKKANASCNTKKSWFGNDLEKWFKNIYFHVC